MQVSDIALMTMARARTMTTKIFNSVIARVSDTPFVARNRKVVLIVLVVWLGVAAAGYLVYRTASSQAHQAFFATGYDAVNNLAAKSRPFVLDQDILSLNDLVRDAQTIDPLLFAAIVDHMNIILSHTDSEMMNRQFSSLERPQALETVAGTRTIAGLTADQQAAIGFYRTILFADVPIGEAAVVLDAGQLEARIGMWRWIYSGLIVLTLAGGVALLVGIDRRKQNKALQTQAAMEKMDRIGPYLLKDKIARGGMAELFKADYQREDGFRREVAIKRIRPHLAENTDFIKMFTREARLAALLQHPNIVQIFDYGNIDNAYFIAMEYVQGKNLGEILAAMKIGLPVDQAVYIISEICKGLDYSHSRVDDETGNALDIVHRDISPQNMLISCKGEVKISDFGISKARSEPNLTQAGIIKGKLAYMSPEQALGEPLDCRADIFALGLLFHETLTGLRVFRFEDEIEAIRAIPERDIEPLTAIIKQIPEELNRIVMKCLAKDRDDRYQRAAEIHADLMAFRKAMQMTYDADDLSTFMCERLTESDDADCVV
jgi:tRNA A-37 threonylcarbamoyl transferase component Bud32